MKFRFKLIVLCFITLPTQWAQSAYSEEATSFHVVKVHPANNATDISLTATIHLQFSDAVNVDSLPLLRLGEVTEDGFAQVNISRSTDLTNASITLAPREFLKPNARYEVRCPSGVESRSGVKLTGFRSRFRTVKKAVEHSKGLVFDAFRFDSNRSMTTVTFGPDHRLYAADAFGNLVRWEVEPDGQPTSKTVLLTDPSRSRQYIDLEWDPKSTSDHLVLWASFAERLNYPSDRRFFTGTIVRWELGEVIKERVVVTGLPHGRERQGGFETLPHQPNGLVFRNGKLYQSVGSTSSSGGPANWGVPEQPLSACILEVDYEQIPHSVDVHPASGFDVKSQNSPIRIFATGVRNALEIVAHSNGNLYTAVNINDRRGRADGVPDHPGIPGNQNALITQTTPDHECLYVLRRGAHYGFPNPARQQFVLSGGNPTTGADPFEISDYPVGTLPDPGFDPNLMYPIWQYGGTSPDGLLEYRPLFSHPLSGSLVCCFYSAGDIAVMPLGTNGLPGSVEKLRGPDGKLPLQGPLDITMDPRTGTLYVADFGKQSKFGADGSMLLLRPVRSPMRSRSPSR